MSYERLGQDNQNVPLGPSPGPMSPEEHAAWLAQHSQQQAEMNARMEECWAKGWHWQGEFCEEPPAPPPGTTTGGGPATVTEAEGAALMRLESAFDMRAAGFSAAVAESMAALEKIGCAGPLWLRALQENPHLTIPPLVQEHGIKALTDSVPLFCYGMKQVQQFLNEVYPAAKIVADGKWTAKTEQYLRQYAARWADLSGHPSPVDAILAAQAEYCAKPGVVCVSAPAGMSRNTKLALGLAAGVGLWLVFFRR